MTNAAAWTLPEKPKDAVRDGVVASLARCFAAADARERPYAHWLLSDALPVDAAIAAARLPLKPPMIGDTFGKRESHNSVRVFFAAGINDRFPVARAIAEAFQAPQIVGRFETLCGIDLAESRLRIEYALDVNGFWLQPHTDISAKKVTCIIYLTEEDWGAKLGTTIYDQDRRPVGASPGGFNTGFVFVPGKDTWHGFEKQDIPGVRRSLIVNYVAADWRSRHELAFPDRTVLSGKRI